MLLTIGIEYNTGIDRPCNYITHWTNFFTRRYHTAKTRAKTEDLQEHLQRQAKVIIYTIEFGQVSLIKNNADFFKLCVDTSGPICNNIVTGIRIS